ncbi:hypothetical protein MHYP_G00160570 [Metynnis hypsauchen]
MTAAPQGWQTERDGIGEHRKQEATVMASARDASAYQNKAVPCLNGEDGYVSKFILKRIYYCQGKERRRAEAPRQKNNRDIYTIPPLLRTDDTESVPAGVEPCRPCSSGSCVPISI